MPVAHTYTKYKDVHTLTNDTNNLVNYVIIKVLCDETSIISTGDLQPDASITINFPVDGEYEVSLAEKEDNGTAIITINTDSFTIETFNNLLVSFIADAEKLLCGCSKCDDCEECNECQDYLGALTKAISFTVLNPVYNTLVNTGLNSISCSLGDEMICSILNEKVFGSSSVKEPLLKILASYFLGFYYYDLGEAEDSEEEQYIKDKYKSVKMLKCITKLGFDLTVFQD
jgi:hypothetical protein